MPNLEELYYLLEDTNEMSKFDLRSEYNNVQIKEGDEWKAAVKTMIGTYEPIVMYFGLCNSPSTFQKLMD